MSEVEDGLERAKHKDRFILKSKLAIRVRDIHRSLLDETPQFVHFAGNSQRKSGLFFKKDNNGKLDAADAKAIAGLCCFICGRYSMRDPQWLLFRRASQCDFPTY